MDNPVNGLTTNGEAMLFEGVPWRPERFIAARFAVIACTVALLPACRFALHLTRVNYPALWTITAILALLNLGYFGLFRRGAIPAARMASFITAQLAVDAALFVLFLHFSGGVINPLFPAGLLLVIPPAASLRKRYAFPFAGFCAILFSSMAVFEATGIVRHYRLFPTTLHANPVYVTGVAFTFSAAALIAAFLTYRIAECFRCSRRECKTSVAEKARVEMEKAHFLDVVAHDLKSPLSAIETMVSSILEAYGKDMNGDTRDTLERIPQRTRDVIRFIQNLLDFSRIRSQEEIAHQFRPLNFLPVVTSTVEMYMDQALDKNITMTIQAEPNIPLISGSREHLERMVANLIANAVRYTQEGGAITVKLGAREQDVILTVADSGIGIPEAELPKIFDEFYRAGNALEATATGTGLGLPIARFIVGKHGGDISVNSVEGEGSVFTVRIPAIPPKPAE